MSILKKILKFYVVLKISLYEMLYMNLSIFKEILIDVVFSLLGINPLIHQGSQFLLFQNDFQWIVIEKKKKLNQKAEKNALHL